MPYVDHPIVFVLVIVEMYGINYEKIALSSL